MGGIIALIVIAALVIILAVAYVAIYNGLVQLRNRVEEAYSTIDVYLKRRFDLIPNLVETVKGYAAHEQQTLSEVMAARSATATADPNARMQAEGNLTQALRGLLAVAEAYPNLKADAQFLNLQQQLDTLEQEIAQARKYYNAIVQQMNTKVETFPSLVVAGIHHFQKAAFFQVEDEAERQGVQVKF